MQRFGLGSLKDQIHSFDKFSETGTLTVKKIKTFLNQPDYDRQPRIFTLTDVVGLTGVSRNTIRKKENDGTLKYNVSHESSGEHNLIENKKEYTLEDIWKIREVCKKGFFNGDTLRPNNCKPFVVAVSMFKGGVGKTTHSTHLAAYCAMRGLRTLLIDLDSQASSTLTFGMIPSLDVDDESTIYEALIEDPNVTKSLIRPTHYYGLDIIPSAISLAAANVNLHQPSLNNFDSMGSPLGRLDNAIKTVKDDYDIIIYDCPPNHEAVALNALFSADSYILPITPNMLSFGSSNAFLYMLSEICSARLRSDENNVTNRLFRILVTNDPQNSESTPITAALRKIYGDLVLNNIMVRTISLDRALNDLSLLYDVTKSNIRGDKKAFSRAVTYMDAVNEELLTTFKLIWNKEVQTKSNGMEAAHEPETISA